MIKMKFVLKTDVRGKLFCVLPNCWIEFLILKMPIGINDHENSYNNT